MSDAGPNTSDGDGRRNAVPAVFFFADSVDRRVKGLQVCLACEKVTGDGTIIGAQRLHGLFRIYPATQDARNKLIIKGITIDKIFVPMMGILPLQGKIP